MRLSEAVKRIEDVGGRFYGIRAVVGTETGKRAWFCTLDTMLGKAGASCHALVRENPDDALEAAVVIAEALAKEE